MERVDQLFYVVNEIHVHAQHGPAAAGHVRDGTAENVRLQTTEVEASCVGTRPPHHRKAPG